MYMRLYSLCCFPLISFCFFCPLSLSAVLRFLFSLFLKVMATVALSTVLFFNLYQTQYEMSSFTIYFSF
jgi:hypothetical protein